MRHAVPATYSTREYAEAGGLMSYGSNVTDAYRQAGAYTGRILKGAKPADLPVVQSTKFELVINAQTARILGLDSAADAARPRRRGDRMRRREFITLLGGAAAAWPLAARAQQPAMPVVGFLNSGSPGAFEHFVIAFRQGLGEAGYVEHRNVGIDYRWAEGQVDRLPALARELVRAQVAVICAGGPPTALAAKAATTTIPIVFTSGEDPVKLGLVASYNRPGGNVTGVALLVDVLGAKRLGLLREIVPAATLIAVLLNPTWPTFDTQLNDVQEAARAVGQQIHVLRANTEREIDAAFDTAKEVRAGAMMVGPSTFFTVRRDQIVGLAARDALPTIYGQREFMAAGALMSYATNLADAYRQAGVYSGKILGGARPAELPVVQSAKFELLINLKIAKSLGLTFPPSLLAIADEVIE